MTNDLVKMERRMWEAYAKQAGGASFDGQPLPTWDELGEERQSCWIAAASVAADRIEELEKSVRNMQQDVAFLRRLRAAGVDNWEGYEFALEDDDD